MFGIFKKKTLASCVLVFTLPFLILINAGVAGRDVSNNEDEKETYISGHETLENDVSCEGRLSSIERILKENQEELKNMKKNNGLSIFLKITEVIEVLNSVISISFFVFVLFLSSKAIKYSKSGGIGNVTSNFNKGFEDMGRVLSSNI
ncbi:MAG: hypothetical protein CfP315_0038 [Candidatus Improbicoccus pseudotrichonymphae]|uniref:Uncharacterized protein n=1 Tax=Candidatus Improbicoccus pseudotrichonymphae TaxID=3033792 RepID=A0AA48HXI7_9FIRM|nr:MAG: hypothetical protein CfP315_0038 [Candidatus Improbicoccus pseudotrichonymphae]